MSIRTEVRFGRCQCVLPPLIARHCRYEIRRTGGLSLRPSATRCHHRYLVVAFAAVISLTHPVLNYVYEECLWFPQNLRSPFTSFSIDWLGLNADLGNPSELVSNLTLQTYHPAVVLKNFSETLEWVYYTCWFLSDPAT